MIQDTWRALGGNQIQLFNRADLGMNAPEYESNEIPSQVEAALNTKMDLIGQRIGDLVWWVYASTSKEQPSNLGLIANAADYIQGSKILGTWVHLIRHIEAESDVADASLLELSIAWDRLHFLFRLNQIANRSTSLEEILESIVNLLAGIVAVDEVFLVGFNEEEYRTVANSGQVRDIPLQLIEKVSKKSTPMGIHEIGSDLDVLEKDAPEIRDIAITGFSGPTGTIRGVLGIVNPAKGKFDASDIQLLTSVAEQVGAIVEAAWVQIRVRQQDRLERELQIATEIQASLLPRIFPKIQGLQISAYLEPAREMGGDFYDVAYASNGAPFLMLGDVAGKGIPASILTALVHAAFHSESFRWEKPDDLLQAINHLIYTDLDRAGTFVTAAVARIETDPLGFEYASAGIGDFILWKNEGENCTTIPSTGLPLGVDQELPIQAERIALEPGDILVMYSDGLTEAVNQDGEPFGAHHLSDIIEIVHQDSVENIQNWILESSRIFCGHQAQLDDVALLIIKANEITARTEVIIPFVLPADRGAASQILTISQQLKNITDGHMPRVSSGVSDEIALALTEVFTNQVEHAYQSRCGLITGRIIVDENKVVADLFDRGQKLTQMPTATSLNLKDPPERGYGLHLIHGLVDGYGYRRLEDGRNHWQLERELDG